MMRCVVVVVVAVSCCCHCAAAATLAASVVMGADHPGVALAAIIVFDLFLLSHKLLGRLLLVVLLGCRDEPLVS